MSLRRQPMLPVAAAAWIAAGGAVVLPDIAGAAAVGAWAVTAVCAVLLARRSRRGIAVAAVACAAAAVVCTHVAIAEPARQRAVEAASGGVVTVTATVTGRLDVAASGDVWFDVATTLLESDGETRVIGVPARVAVAADARSALRGVDLGAVVEVRGSAFAPGGGDRAAVIVRADAVRRLHPASGLWAPLADLRAGLVSAASTLPGSGGALVPGLAVGDTSAVSPALDDDMKASSLSHLTAVSGANCAIVVALAFGAAALCGAPRGVRVAAGTVTLALFVLLVTPEPSVVRAAAMALIAMIAVGLGRPAAGVGVLALAVTLVLALDPWIALSMGFALSAAATAALLVLARPLASGLGRIMPHPLALAIAVPLSAQLACGPLLVLLDPAVPLLGVIANLLAAPAAPVATVTGFFACLAAPLPIVQSGLVALAWLPASWIGAVAEVTAAVPGQRVPWPAGLPGAALLAGLGALVVVAVAMRPARRAGRMLRAGAIATVAVVGGLVAGQSALAGAMASWTVPADWQVVACDIGQGDAVLLRSGGRVMLVDTGPDAALLSACLDRFGVERIDVLVLTHFDLDHSGGVDAVVGRVQTVLHGPLDADGARDAARLEAAGADVRAVQRGARGVLGDAAWRVLWPAPDVREPGNAASVAVAVTGAGFPATLLLGDLDEEAQARLRHAVGGQRFDVIKVAHHGSADQDPALYADVGAALALISVGADNDYGHPRPSLLTMLRSLGTQVARTDQDGVIAVWRDREGLRLWRERVGPAD
ncbi:ComEC/Rec2 family competence protein [Microbacterium sp. NPDC091313]